MQYEKLLSKIRCGIVEDRDIESYIQGLEYEKWKVSKDLEATEEVVIGKDDEGDNIIETRLVNVYEPVDISEQMKQWKLDNYQILRKPIYPDIAEYIDAMVKGDNNSILEYIDKCLDIKEKYPKL